MNINFEKFLPGEKLDQSFVDKINRNNLLLVRAINEIDPDGIREIDISSFDTGVADKDGYTATNSMTTLGTNSFIDGCKFSEMNKLIQKLTASGKQIALRSQSSRTVVSDLTEVTQAYGDPLGGAGAYRVYPYYTFNVANIARKPSGYEWENSVVSVDIRYEITAPYYAFIDAGTPFFGTVSCNMFPCCARDGATTDYKFWSISVKNDPASDFDGMRMYILPLHTGDSGLKYDGSTLDIKNMVLYFGHTSADHGDTVEADLPFTLLTGIHPMQPLEAWALYPRGEITVASTEIIVHANVNALFWR